MDMSASNKTNVEKWADLHQKSSTISIRTTPNYAVKQILDLKPKRKLDNILEVGCGFGRNLAFLIKNDYSKNYYGIDLTKTSVNKCIDTLADLNAKTDIRVGNAGKFLDFPNNFFSSVFDIMSAITFISDISERKKYFSEIARVLEPEGHYYFLCPRKNGKFHDIFENQDLLEKGYIKRKLDGMLEKVYTKDELTQSFPNFDYLKLEVVSEHTRAFGDEKFIREDGFWFGDFKKRK
ncbi:class I SAM-dependent methyltransferase [Lactococcus protaetiae]|uniref:Class I SAM-dependent methyltransferase n=1 Tax=Lactococcus protaetiae TaxID=2592653 RepID=A0A514Z8R1_9LACT|nr:class I SAM-dependent methyltransferase [Lactococcus protaetiae]QDK70975.1 class I SAM-dependent methyltransferase [Lactococcus protaetiae]